MNKNLNKVNSYKAECDRVLLYRARNSKAGHVFKFNKNGSEKLVFDFLIALKGKN